MSVDLLTAVEDWSIGAQLYNQHYQTLRFVPTLVFLYCVYLKLCVNVNLRSSNRFNFSVVLIFPSKRFIFKGG